MYLPNTEYKSNFVMGITFSFVIHLLIGYYVIKNCEMPAPPPRDIKIDEVNFMSKEDVIRQRQEKNKTFLPKVEKKQEKQLVEHRPVEQEAPKQELEKTKPLIEPQKIELKVEPKTFETKQMEVIIPKAKGLEVKNFETEPKLVSKNRPDLSATEVKQLINLNEVGDRKISQKTLEVAEQLQKAVKVRTISEPQEAQLQEKQKNLVNLDRKIATMDEGKRINLASKTYEMAKIDTASATASKRVSGSAFDSAPKTVVEERSSAKQPQNLRNVRIISEPQRTELKEKAFESSKIDDKKVLVDKKKSNSLGDVQSIQTFNKEKSKSFDILGEIKDRPIQVFVQPEYPAWAKKERIEANVRIYLEVAKDGGVVPSSLRVEITSGYLDLDNYVIEVLKTWRFVPINKNEIQRGSVTFKFRLS